MVVKYIKSTVSVVFLSFVCLLGLASNDTVILRYHFDTLSIHKPGNYIIAELANDNGLSVRQCNLKFVVNKKFYSAEHDGTTSLHCTLKVDTIVGITRYRKYNVASFLKPDYFLAEVTYSDINGLQFSSLKTKLKTDSITTIILPVPGTNIAVRVLHPVFATNRKEEFGRILLLVKDYYALSTIAQKGLETVQLSDFDNGNPYVSLVNYAEALRILQKIDSLHFADSLPLIQEDPAQLLEKCKSLTIECYRRSLATDRLLAKKKDAVPIDNEAIINLCIEMIRSWPEHSEFSNPASSKVFADFAMINWEGVWCTQFGPVLKHFLKSEYDFDFQQKVKEVGKGLFDKVVKLSDEQLAAKRFTESGISVANAIGLAKALRMYDEADALSRKQSLATGGIYNSYLQVAESAVMRGNMALAEKYLQKAIEYQAQNSGVVMSDMSLNPGFELFTNACLEKGAALNNDGDYVNALVFLDKAVEYAIRIGFYTRAGQLEQEIKNAHQHLYDEKLLTSGLAIQSGEISQGIQLYRDALSLRTKNIRYVLKRSEEDSLYLFERKHFVNSTLIQAKDLMTAKNTESAFELACRAQFIADSLAITDDTLICVNLMGIGNQLFDNSITATGSAIWDYDPENAYKKLDMAEWISSKFCLTDCFEVNDILYTYKKKIENLECRLAVNKYQKFATLAEARFSAGLFAEGASAADSALAVNEPHLFCTLDKSGLKMLLENNRYKIKYAGLLKKLEIVYTTQRPDSVDANLQRVISFFNVNKTQLSGFTAPGIVEFIKTHQQTALVDYYLEHFYTRSNFMGCLQILEACRLNGYKVENTAKFQEKLGIAMADATSVEPVEIKVQQFLATIITDKQWFSIFNEAFTNQKIPVLKQIRNKIQDLKK